MEYWLTGRRWCLVLDLWRAKESRSLSTSSVSAGANWTSSTRTDKSTGGSPVYCEFFSVCAFVCVLSAPVVLCVCVRTCIFQTFCTIINKHFSVCVSRRWQDCNSKWQKFVSDQKELEEWLNDAEGTLKLAESNPLAHRQHLRVKHTYTTFPFWENVTAQI